MFKEARIKLTIWYVVVTMAISLFFSVSIYSRISNELDRGYRRLGVIYRDRGGPFGLFFDSAALEQLSFAKRNLLLTLLVINAGILGLTGTAGYFLAGRTLKPIQNILEDQKRFISDASHELRTPLTALKTSIEVALRNKNFDVTQATGVLTENLEEVNNMQTLTDELLILSRPVLSNGRANSETVYLDQLVEESIKKIEVLAQMKEIKIEYSPAKINVNGDAKSLIQVFVILLDNAIKYSSNGSKVSVASSKTDGHVLVKVKDNGIGIEADDLPHIFDRFYRADQSRSKEKVEGFGLGLSIAKKIIEEQGGTISVESQTKPGSVFTISLPKV